MASLILYTLLIIFFQTAFVLVLSWCTLSCRFPPSASELQEITLMKLLYLYDPVACGRVESYNFTTSISNRTTLSTIIWPAKNEIAARFRWRLKFSLTLHILWLSLGLASALYGRRLLGLYLTVLPFTAAGATLLVSDIYMVTTYLLDVEYASTELTYGTKAAPFLVMMTLRRLAQDERQNYQDSSAPKKKIEEMKQTVPLYDSCLGSAQDPAQAVGAGGDGAGGGARRAGRAGHPGGGEAAAALLLHGESIIRYIGADGDFLGQLSPSYSTDSKDTTWLPLLFAYMSSRAIVLWIVNYWLVLDNSMAGLAAYRAIKKAPIIPKKRRRERQDFR